MRVFNIRNLFLNQINFKKMKQPINQKTEVLYSLLQGEQTTMSIVKLGVCNPTSTITHLRRAGVNIVCDNKPHKNKFGRMIKYGRFNILNKREATKIYNNLIK
jgi:hypothetical protein